MASKLTEITSKYHTFVDNQVLTKDQLNEFVCYLDDQDRLSRVFLNGVGVVCGFEVSKTTSKIKLTQGVGVTSDGDLIQLKESLEKSPNNSLAQGSISYSFFRKFEDNSAHYAPFKRTVFGEENTTKIIDLYELLTETEENASPLNQLSDLNNMVVLLYLESFAKEGDLCTSIDCDNQGIEQVNRLRVLLVSKSDAVFISSGDSIYSRFNFIENYFNLPSVEVKRVVLNQINSSKYEELKRAYYDAINSDELLKNLKDGINKIISGFGGFLQLTTTKTTLNSNLSKLESHLAFKAYSVPFNIQYRYDFLKDIVDTYNEIKELLLNLKEICSPDITAFPKHLMLGSISEINTNPKQLRHSFYKSPAASCGCDNIQKAKNLVTRLFELINRFTTKPGSIKITPSNKLPELSKRSIPFYYNITKNLIKSWDYFKTKRFKENTNLSYNRDKLAAHPHIQEPLNYNTDQFDFYRIEGHQGKDYRDVLEQLDDLKTSKGLSFDVKALSVNINTENLDVDDYQCEFEDLKVMLKAWIAEQDCILAQVANFFSGFSTKVPGANVKEGELDLKKGISANFESISSFPNAKIGAEKSVITAKIPIVSLYQPPIATNVVPENIITVKDTLGEEMQKAFDENKGGSANDIIASATAKIKDKIDTPEWNADPDLKEFVGTKSVELMARTHVLNKLMPTTVAVVDTTKVTDYKISLSQLCNLVQKLKAGYQSTQLSTGLRAFMGLLINQLSTVCCSGKKLEILLEEVNKRKEQILLRLQLSKFIEKHSGLEHKAGVEPGGTFVLVYKNKEVVSDNKTITEKLTATRRFSATDLTATKLNISNKFLNIEKLSFTEKNSLLKTATSYLKYDTYLGGLKNIEALERFVPISMVPDNTVVADFALPYMCCSDCAPVNYIITKPSATLRLEKDKYCLLSDTEPILFEVTPVGGVVQVDPATAGVKIEGSKLVFNPDNFPEEMFGKPIHFTVNSQVTDAELVVYKGIIADFKVPEEPTNEAIHNFVAEGQLEGARFLWEFGDGGTSTDRNPTHTYKLPVNDENKVTVSLMVTASNGVCKSMVEHDLIFETIKPSISITPTAFCQDDKTPYPITVTPESSHVKIEGEGVLKNDSGGFVFVPAAAKPGPLEFVLNDEASGVSITVHIPPHAVCVPNQKGNQLIIANQSKNATKYEWTINGSQHVTSNLDPIVINLSPNGPHEWKINLVASKDGPCSSGKTSVTFKTKFIDEPPSNNCAEVTKKGLSTDNKILKEFKPVDSSIVSEIWKQTLETYKIVADQVDEYLSGDENSMLLELFPQLLKRTAEMVVEMGGNKEVQAQLTLLFELQLRLFYNILGCQSNERLKEFSDEINRLLKQILDLLAMLKKFKVIFSNTMKNFIEVYAKKVENSILLPEHIKLIITEKLI